MSLKNHRLKFALLAIGIVTCAFWAAISNGVFDRSEPQVGDVPAESIPAPPLPPLASSLYLNTKPDAEFVGAQRCVACHQDQHKSFLATPHNRAIVKVDPSEEPPDGVFDHAKSRRSYQIYRRGGKMRHREFIRDPKKGDIIIGDFPVAYTIGSGHHSRSYLIVEDGFLVESPITWYTAKTSWGMSPGYDQPHHYSFNRPVIERCAACHAGRVDNIDGALHKLQIHGSISCESCHGPGSLHVKARESKSHFEPGIDYTIVNPAKLSRELNESVCARCHRNDAASITVRGRHLKDFRPGLPLADFRVDYRLPRESTSMKVTGHFEQMKLSRCYTESQKMTCTTCHNPHDRPTAATKVEYFRARCQTCHQKTNDCKLAEPARLKKSPENNCLQCHMPQTDTDIPHFAFTHHRIGLNHQLEKDERKQAEPYVPSGDISRMSKLDQDRCLGLAYMLAGSDGKPFAETYQKWANELLTKVYEAGIRDADVLAALAMLSPPPKKAKFAEEALKAGDISPDARIYAMQSLGESYLMTQQWKEAKEVYKKLVKFHRHPKSWTHLGVACARTDDPAGALDAFQKAVAIRPDRQDLHEFLAQTYQRLGKNELALKHFKHAERLSTLNPPPTLHPR